MTNVILDGHMFFMFLGVYKFQIYVNITHAVLPMKVSTEYVVVVHYVVMLQEQH